MLSGGNIPSVALFLPDGRHFLFTVGAAGRRVGVYVGDRRTHQAPGYRTDGECALPPLRATCCFWTRYLMAQPFDPDASRVIRRAGAGRGPRRSRQPRRRGLFRVERGNVAYAGATLRPGRLTWYDCSGTRWARSAWRVNTTSRTSGCRRTVPPCRLAGRSERQRSQHLADRSGARCRPRASPSARR